MTTQSTLFKDREYYIKKYNLEVETHNGIMYIKAGRSETRYCHQLNQEITSHKYIRFNEDTWNITNSRYDPQFNKLIHLRIYLKVEILGKEEFIPEMYQPGNANGLLEFNDYPSHNTMIYPEITKFCKEFIVEEYPEYFI